MNILSKTANRIRALAWALRQKTREIGIVATFGHLGRKLAEALRTRKRDRSQDAFDARYGTDTANVVSIYALGIPSEMLGHANRYETVSAEFLKASISELPADLSDFVFIDLGAGKGKALLLASLFPFRQIIGVELATSLTDVARRNLAVFKEPAQRCRNFSVISQDAREFDFPVSNLVIYLYNPFDEGSMQVVVERLGAFVAQHKKRAYVIYHHAVHRSVWDRSTTFRVLAEHERSVTFEDRARGTSR